MGAKLPFKRVVGCNIGNPQALDQKPITFFRQVTDCSLEKFPPAFFQKSTGADNLNPSLPSYFAAQNSTLTAAR